MKKQIADLVLRWANHQPAGNPRVLRGGLVIEVRPGAGAPMKTFSLDPRNMAVEHEECTVKIVGASLGSGAIQFDLDSRESAERLYRQVQRQIQRATTPAGGWRAWWKPALAAAAVAYMVLVLSSPTAPVQTTAALPPTVQAPAAAAAAAAAPAANLSDAEAKLVASLPGIQLPGRGKVYYVFSDPNCPYCKQLESSIEQVKEYQPVVIPLGYKAGSRELAAAVLCSKDPVAAWKKAVAGQLEAPACEKGLVQVAQNMQAFERLNLTSTPTTVTPKGLLVSGAAKPEELRQILAQ